MADTDMAQGRANLDRLISISQVDVLGMTLLVRAASTIRGNLDQHRFLRGCVTISQIARCLFFFYFRKVANSHEPFRALGFSLLFVPASKPRKRPNGGRAGAVGPRGVSSGSAGGWKDGALQVVGPSGLRQTELGMERAHGTWRALDECLSDCQQP